jgi:hypothetical protein
LIGLPRELRTRDNMRAIYCENRNGATLQTLCSRLRSGFSWRLRSAVVRAGRSTAWPFRYRIGAVAFFNIGTKFYSRLSFLNAPTQKPGQTSSRPRPRNDPPTRLNHHRLALSFNGLGLKNWGHRRGNGSPGLSDASFGGYLLRSWLTLFEGLKRLGGDEERLGFSVLQQASNGIVKP